MIEVVPYQTIASPSNRTDEGIVLLEIPASELTWTGLVHEELRVSRGTTTIVPHERPVLFDDAAIDV